MNKTQIEAVLQEFRNSKEEKNMTTQVLDLVTKEEDKDMEATRERIVEEAKDMGVESNNSAHVEGVEVRDDVSENISKLFQDPAGNEQSVYTESVTDEQAPMKNNNEVKHEDLETHIPGVKIIGKCTAEVATDSLWGNKLHIRALLSKETNKRKYQIFEVDQAGKELGTISFESLFRASEVLSGTSSKIKHFIQDLDGNYNGQLADILSRMSMIEKKRVLSPEEVLDIDSCKTVEEFWKKLQDWFESHLDDVRVGVVNIKGRTHVALVKRGKTGLNEIFKAVAGEIAPKMRSSLIKGELYRRDLLIHDCNPDCKDTQLTVGAIAQYELGIVNDKIISFAFDDDFIRKIKEGYEIYRIEEEEE